MREWHLPRRRPRPVPLVLGLLMVKLVLLRLLVFEVPGPAMVLVDLAALAVLVGLVALVAPGPATSPALWSLNAAISVFLATAVVYAGYYQTLPTFTSLDEADQAVDVRSSVPDLLEWQLALFFADLVVAPVVGLWLHGDRWLPPRRTAGRRRLLRLGAMVSVGALVVTVVLRGGADIRNEQYRAELFGILGYEADALIRELRPEPTIDLATAYDRVSELKEGYVGPTVTDPARARGFGSARGKNLVVVQLESLQEFVIGLKVDGREVTPNLNRLVGESYYFPRHHQQVGKGNTVDAEFISNTSIYPVGNVAMSTGYGDRDLPSLPKLLGERGYTSETFNVNWARFWDHDKLFAGLGFDRYHEKDEFPGEKFNFWGVSDDEMYTRSMVRIADLGRQGPFYVQLVTASGHGPFEVPQDKIRFVLPDELARTEVGAYLQAQNYADWALGRFIENLKRFGLWDESLFVAYGDHAGLNTEDTVEGVRSLGVSYDFLRRFNTPLLMHVPGQPGSREDLIAGEVDILPTIANLMGISLAAERFVHFGVDLLNTERNAVGVRYHAPTGTFVADDVLFVPGRGFADGAARSLATGAETPTGGLRDEYDHVLGLMDLSDAYVRSLPKR